MSIRALDNLDADSNGLLTIEELVGAVGRALNGFPS